MNAPEVRNAIGIALAAAGYAAAFVTPAIGTASAEACTAYETSNPKAQARLIEASAAAPLPASAPEVHKGPKYLVTPIAEAIRSYPSEANRRHGMTADGYTKRSGAPSSIMIRLQGEKRFRRVMVWQFSNAGTCFVRIKGEALIVREYDIPDALQR